MDVVGWLFSYCYISFWIYLAWMGIIFENNKKFCPKLLMGFNKNLTPFGNVVKITFFVFLLGGGMVTTKVLKYIFIFLWYFLVAIFYLFVILFVKKDFRESYDYYTSIF